MQNQTYTCLSRLPSLSDVISRPIVDVEPTQRRNDAIFSGNDDIKPLSKDIDGSPKTYVHTGLSDVTNNVAMDAKDALVWRPPVTEFGTNPGDIQENWENEAPPSDALSKRKRQDESPSKGDNGGDKPRKRRTRTNYTRTQMERLEGLFAASPYPSREEYAALSRDLKLTGHIIKTWFQNKRSRCRKHVKSTMSNFFPTQTISPIDGFSMGHPRNPQQWQLMSTPISYPLPKGIPLQPVPLKMESLDRKSEISLSNQPSAQQGFSSIPTNKNSDHNHMSFRQHQPLQKHEISNERHVSPHLQTTDNGHDHVSSGLKFKFDEHSIMMGIPEHYPTPNQSPMDDPNSPLMDTYSSTSRDSESAHHVTEENLHQMKSFCNSTPFTVMDLDKGKCFKFPVQNGPSPIYVHNPFSYTVQHQEIPTRRLSNDNSMSGRRLSNENAHLTRRRSNERIAIAKRRLSNENGSRRLSNENGSHHVSHEHSSRRLSNEIAMRRLSTENSRRLSNEHSEMSSRRESMENESQNSSSRAIFPSINTPTVTNNQSVFPGNLRLAEITTSTPFSRPQNLHQYLAYDDTISPIEGNFRLIDPNHPEYIPPSNNNPQSLNRNALHHRELVSKPPHPRECTPLITKPKRSSVPKRMNVNQMGQPTYENVLIKQNPEDKQNGGFVPIKTAPSDTIDCHRNLNKIRQSLLAMHQPYNAPPRTQNGKPHSQSSPLDLSPPKDTRSCDDLFTSRGLCLDQSDDTNEIMKDDVANKMEYPETLSFRVSESLLGSVNMTGNISGKHPDVNEEYSGKPIIRVHPVGFDNSNNYALY